MLDGTVTIETSHFCNNNAARGGVIDSDEGNVKIKQSDFHNNRAIEGGVLYSVIDTMTIETSNFHNNFAVNDGGVFYSETSTIKMDSCNFTKNRSPIGAVIYAIKSSDLLFLNYLLFDSNLADRLGVIYLVDSQLNANNSSSLIFSNNMGSLVAVNSNITFSGCDRFLNNTPLLNATDEFQEGRVVALFNGSNATLF